MVYRLQASDNKRRKAKTRRLLKKYEDAVVELAFKGTRHPEEYEAIEQEYQRARKALLQHIDEV